MEKIECVVVGAGVIGLAVAAVVVITVLSDLPVSTSRAKVPVKADTNSVRPPGPSAPRSCATSTSSVALYSRQSSCIAIMSGVSESIENKLSVTTKIAAWGWSRRILVRPRRR